VAKRLFCDINVSQGSVATYEKSGGIRNNRLTANLPRNVSVKKIENRLRFDKIMAVSLWLHFFDSPCTCTHEMINTAFTPQPQSITALWHLGYCGVF